MKSNDSESFRIVYAEKIDDEHDSGQIDSDLGCALAVLFILFLVSLVGWIFGTGVPGGLVGLLAILFFIFVAMISGTGDESKTEQKCKEMLVPEHKRYMITSVVKGEDQKGHTNTIIEETHFVGSITIEYLIVSIRDDIGRDFVAHNNTDSGEWVRLVSNQYELDKPKEQLPSRLLKALNSLKKSEIKEGMIIEFLVRYLDK